VGPHRLTARHAHSPTRGAMLQESTNALVRARRKQNEPAVRLRRSLLTLFINCSCVVATVKRYAVSSTHAELDFLVVRANRGQIDREQARRAPHPPPSTRHPCIPVPSPRPCPRPNHPTTHTSCTSSRRTVFCCAPTGGRGKGLPSREKTRGRTAQGSGRADQLRQVVDVWGCGRGSRGKGHFHDQADATGAAHNDSG
jgi:hypothetical protein